MLHDVFISYAHDAVRPARPYYQYLTERGLDVWFDELADRDRTLDQIADALSRSTYVLLLWSNAARNSNFVNREITLAEELGKKIIPVKLDSTGFSTVARLILAGTIPIDGRKEFPRSALAKLARRIAPESEKDANVYLLLNMKGGVGKTTLAANLAGTFHSMGRSVLLVDLDAQANLSNLLMSAYHYVEAVSMERSVITCFEESLATGSKKPAAERMFDIDATGVVPRPTRLAFSLTNPLSDGRFDLVVGQFELFKFSLAKNHPKIAGSSSRFKTFIEQAKQQYDVILLDAAPSNSFITECAIECADDIVAPATPDKYALRGIQAISRLMVEGMSMNPPKPVHVVLNNVPAQVSTAEQAIRDAYPRESIPVRIRDSAFFKVRNADPNVRVRNPLGTLAYARGGEDVQLSLRKICEELVRRSGARKAHDPSPKAS